MRDMAKKKAHDARRHYERMQNDIRYRMRKLLATIRARCQSGKGRTDWEWYGGTPVNLTVDELVFMWDRDGAAKMQRPSIDRKENKLGYVFENCHFIEHADNIRKMIPTRRKRRWYRKPAEPTTEVA